MTAKPILTNSERYQEHMADVEARWQQIQRMMRCTRWKQSELAGRFFKEYAEQCAGVGSGLHDEG